MSLVHKKKTFAVYFYILNLEKEIVEWMIKYPVLSPSDSIHLCSLATNDSTIFSMCLYGMIS